MPGVLTVAGVDRNREASTDASAQGITIGVSAPSEQLLGAVPGGGVVLWDGTSGATPIVAGVAALVIAAHPELDAANVINRIVSTATPAGADGPDPIYGFGLMDAAAAVEDDVEAVTDNPMGDLAAWITVNRRAASTATPTLPPVAPVEPDDETIVAAPISPLGTMYPTMTQLRDVGLPLAIVLVFVTIFGLLVTFSTRQFRSLRRKE